MFVIPEINWEKDKLFTANDMMNAFRMGQDAGKLDDFENDDDAEWDFKLRIAARLDEIIEKRIKAQY